MLNLNRLRDMMARGEITEADLRAMDLQGSLGGQQGPSPPQALPPPQNVLARMLSPQEQFAQGDQTGALPMGSMRNESTGKVTYFQPNAQAPRTQADPGFSDRPYPVAAQAPQQAAMRVYGVGGGVVSDLGEEPARALPVDRTRPGIDIPGLGKGFYTADGRSVVGTAPDGSQWKALLGYDAAASDARNARALAQEKARADIGQTQERTGLLRDQRTALANPPAPVPVEPKPTAGQTATDKEFAKEYVAFKAAGGYTDTVKQLEQLREVSKALGSDETLTGPGRGILPDKVRAFTNPDALKAKDAVEEVVQRNLRIILGAQFTEREGERLIARAYNPQLSTEENKKRVDRLIRQIDAAARTKQDASDYFEANGTLTGWRGKLPTLGDFNPDASGADVPDASARVVGKAYDTPKGKLVWLGNGKWRAP